MSNVLKRYFMVTGNYQTNFWKIIFYRKMLKFNNFFSQNLEWIIFLINKKKRLILEYWASLLFPFLFFLTAVFINLPTLIINQFLLFLFHILFRSPILRAFAPVLSLKFFLTNISLADSDKGLRSEYHYESSELHNASSSSSRYKKTYVFCKVLVNIAKFYLRKPRCEWKWFLNQFCFVFFFQKMNENFFTNFKENLIKIIS